MKIITHRSFIHIFLITIITIVSATVPEPECGTSLNQVITKYLQNDATDKKTCTVVKNLTDKFDMTTIDPHLCTTIHETVNIICQLNSTRNFTESEFAADMKELRKESMSPSKILANIKSVIENPVYINATADKPVITTLNRQLAKYGQIICASFMDSYNPLCSVLLWTDRALVDTKIFLTKNTPVAQEVEQELKKPLSRPSETQKPKSNPPASKKAEVPTKKQGPVEPSGNVHANTPAVVNTITQGAKPEEARPQSKPKATMNSGEPAKPKDTPKKADVSKTTTVKPENNSPPDHVDEPILDQIVESQTHEAGDKPVPEEETTIAEDKDGIGLPLDVRGPEESEGQEENEGKPPKSNNPSPNVPENHIARDQSSVYPVGSDPEPPQHFFAYFMAVSLICLIFYVGYHKKHKIMGIIFEGRKSRGGRGRRRPNTAGYRKLDCTLEEAVTSQCNSNVTHVIY